MKEDIKPNYMNKNKILNELREKSLNPEQKAVLTSIRFIMLPVALNTGFLINVFPCVFPRGYEEAGQDTWQINIGDHPEDVETKNWRFNGTPFIAPGYKRLLTLEEIIEAIAPGEVKNVLKKYLLKLELDKDLEVKETTKGKGKI